MGLSLHLINLIKIKSPLLRRTLLVVLTPLYVVLGAVFAPFLYGLWEMAKAYREVAVTICEEFGEAVGDIWVGYRRRYAQRGGQ